MLFRNDTGRIPDKELAPAMVIPMFSDFPSQAESVLSEEGHELDRLMSAKSDSYRTITVVHGENGCGKSRLV